MAVQASWGSMTFQVSPNRITAITGLTTGFNRKADTNEDTSGQPTTNTKGLDLQSVSFDVSYVAGLGVDPRSMIDAWKSQFFKRYPLYIGGRRFGARFMELDSVDVGNIVLDNRGRFIQVDISITLTEYVPPDTTVSAKKTSGGAASSTAGATSAKPSTTDKSSKKTVKVR